MSDKSKYYTSAQNYTDEDNQLRTFTFIDHDKKSSLSISPTDEEISAAKDALLHARESLITSILEKPASFCPGPFYDFAIRGEDKESISWNEKMLRDEGMPFNRLRDLCALLSNRWREHMRII